MGSKQLFDFLAAGDIPNVGMDPLDYVLDYRYAPSEGSSILEFGVYKGTTINKIAAKYPAVKIYGFDSFEGLPEEWDRGHKGTWSHKGAFSTEGRMPQVPANVSLIKGWFDKTLPVFLKSFKSKVGLLHIDCDLYSSTKTVLECVEPYLARECIVVFDEIFNYPGWERNEAKALQEFIVDFDWKWNWNWLGMNGAVDIYSKGNSAANQSAALLLTFK